VIFTFWAGQFVEMHQGQHIYEPFLLASHSHFSRSLHLPEIRTLAYAIQYLITVNDDRSRVIDLQRGQNVFQHSFGFIH